MVGYIFVFCSIIFFSLVNITDKLVSGAKDKKLSLTLRYSFGLVFAYAFTRILGEDIHFPGWQNSIILMLTGVIAYFVNIIMYKGMKHLNTGTFFMIGYSYYVFLFVINSLYFGKSEMLAPLKTLFAIIFIIYVLYLTYSSGKQKGRADYIGYIIAIICALGWTVCFFIEGLFIKNNITSPFQTLFIIYIGSLLVSLVNLFKNKAIFSKQLIAPSIGGILIVLGSGSILFAYKHLQLNIVNTASVSEIFFTTIFAILILKEKHSKDEMRKILYGIVLLAVFLGTK